MEYQRVLNHLEKTGGKASRIIKIERVQNPGLYKVYLVKKQSMDGADNEMQLFHGTKSDNISQINVNNFDRNFAGANGKKLNTVIASKFFICLNLCSRLASLAFYSV